MVTIDMREEIVNRNHIGHKTHIDNRTMVAIDKIVIINQDMVVHPKVDPVVIDKTSDLAVIMVIVRNMAVQVAMIIVVVAMTIVVAAMTIVIPVGSTIAGMQVSTIDALMSKDPISDLVVNMGIARNIVVLPVVAMTIMKEDQDNLMIVVDMANKE
jgi:hypothetical protein